MLEQLTVRDIYAEQHRRSFRRFARAAWAIADPAHAFRPNWHVDAICDHLQAVAEGRIRRLIINVPPGLAKSLLVSVLWPAWMWLKRPSWQVLSTSYAMELATRDAVRTRMLVESEWYQETFRPGWGFTDDQNAKTFYRLSSFGARKVSSPGSGATGFRGDCVIVDDPLNAEDAHSPTERAKVIRWWDESMSSRGNDPTQASFVVIMQRLHEEDLTGHLLEQGGYEHLRLPMEYEPDTPCATSIGWVDPRGIEGELLFPSFFPRSEVEGQKVRLGSQGYSGQYQQRPAPAGGTIFEGAWIDAHRFEFWPTELEWLVQSWDCSFKGREDSDRVRGQLWGGNGANRYLLAKSGGILTFTKTLEAVEAFAEACEELAAKHGWPRPRTKLVEDKANGPAVIDMLRSRLEGLIAVEPHGGKEVRAHACAPLFEAGNVWAPSDRLCPWVKEWRDELVAFPRGRYDDEVDATTQVLNRMNRKKKTPYAGRPEGVDTRRVM